MDCNNGQGSFWASATAVLALKVVVGILYLPLLNAGRDVLLGKILPEPVAGVAPIGNQRGARRRRLEEEPSAHMIVNLPLRQKQDDRLAGAIADSVERGVQAAFRAPETTGNIPISKVCCGARPVHTSGS